MPFKNLPRGLTCLYLLGLPANSSPDWQRFCFICLLSVCKDRGACHGVLMEIRGQLPRVGSFLLPCGFEVRLRLSGSAACVGRGFCQG